MQSDQKIGLSLLIALTGFGLALGFGRRESPAREVVEQAELAPAGEAFAVVETPQPRPEPAGGFRRPTIAPPAETRPTTDVASAAPMPEPTRPTLDPPRPDVSRMTPAPSPSEVEPQRAAPRPQVRLRSYTIRSGDTLSGIAARELGDSRRYAEIYRANEERLGNPDAIRVGDAILIPMR